MERDYFKSWLVGFSEGEGSFNFHMRRRKSKLLSGYYYGKDITFTISLRADDIKILKMIHKNLKSGHLRRYQQGRQIGNYVSNPMIQFRISSIKDLAEKIIPIFDKYPPLTKKSRDYKIWREIVLFCYKKTKLPSSNQFSQRYSKEDYRYLFDLSNKLKKVRKYVEKS